MVKAQKWVLAERPQGIPGPGCFSLETFEADAPQGGLLAQTLYFSIDPGMRSRLSGDSYSAALELGEVIESAGIARVIESQNKRFSVGDLVMAGTGWQSHIASSGKALVKLDPALFQDKLSLTAAIGVLGIPGLTAYFGLLDLGSPQEGETLLVSSAAGTVGATAGQIGKLKGLTVVGLAGSDDKCAYLKALGFDAAINYRTDDLEGAIRAACPQGVDIYFDNVGGEMLDTAITCMTPKGRIVISGAMSEYNRDRPRGIRNTLHFITHRLRMEGLVVFDYVKDFPKAQMEMAGWIQSGALTYSEEIIEGIAHAPSAFAGLFDGSPAHGRRIIKL